MQSILDGNCVYVEFPPLEPMYYYMIQCSRRPKSKKKRIQHKWMKNNIRRSGWLGDKWVNDVR